MCAEYFSQVMGFQYFAHIFVTNFSKNVIHLFRYLISFINYSGVHEKTINSWIMMSIRFTFVHVFFSVMHRPTGTS